MKPSDQSIPQNRAILEEITKGGNKTEDSANSHKLICLPSTPQPSLQGGIGHPHQLLFPSAARHGGLWCTNSLCSDDTRVTYEPFHTSVLLGCMWETFSPPLPSPFGVTASEPTGRTALMLSQCNFVIVPLVLQWSGYNDMLILQFYKHQL